MFCRELAFIGKNGTLKKLLKIPHSGFDLGFERALVSSLREK
jgi:hypothetical protein